MKKIYISIVSHGHLELIRELRCLEIIAASPKIEVVIKENSGEIMSEFCMEIGAHYIEKPQNVGFGENNNIVYDYCLSELGMDDDDIFVVLNPDVIVTVEVLEKLLQEMTCGTKLATINLFKDTHFKEYDNSIREFPTLKTFISSFVFNRNKSIYDKSKIKKTVEVDWAAGSFLAFKSSHYQELNGFDKTYFMYCEDIDICFRSSILGVPVKYYPNIKAIHMAKHGNRNIFSIHFFWHLKNAIIFLIKRFIYEWKN